MKNISIIWRQFVDTSRHASPTEAEWVGWLRDPLSHPAIEAMVERERADLPFDRGRVAIPRTARHCC